MKAKHITIGLITMLLVAFFNMANVSASIKTYTIGVGEKIKLPKKIAVETVSSDAASEVSADASCDASEDASSEASAEASDTKPSENRIVDASGKSVTGIKVGKVKLKLVDGTKVKIVVKKAPKTLTLKSSASYLFTNDTAKLLANVNKNSASRKITFSSSNKKVATVSKKGVIKAKKKGTVKLTAKAYNGVKASVKLQIKSSSKLICLTFDDGPSSYTPKLLDALKKYNFHGTFFMVGVEAQGKKSTIQTMMKNGNELGMHSWHHDYLTKMSEAQIESDVAKTRALIKDYTGVSPVMFRPPYGATNDTVYKALKNKGCPVIMWNINVNDYETTSSEVVYNNIKKRVHPGAVLVLHDSHSWSVDGLIKAMPELKNQGYELVTVSEFARLKKIKLAPGKRFVGTSK